MFSCIFFAALVSTQLSICESKAQAGLPYPLLPKNIFKSGVLKMMDKMRYRHDQMIPHVKKSFKNEDDSQIQLAAATIQQVFQRKSQSHQMK